MSDVPTADRGIDEIQGAAPEALVRSGLEGVDPLQALQAIVSGLKEQARTESVGLNERFLQVCRFDDESRRLADALVSPAWWGAPRSRSRHVHALHVSRDAFGLLADAYQECIYAYEDISAGAIDSEGLNTCRARLAAAGAERVKWERCAGGPAHGPLWRWMGAAFSRSIDHNHSAIGAAFGMGRQRGASVAQEYLHAVALASASLDQLAPHFLPVVDRLILFALPMLQFEPEPVLGAVCCVAPDLTAAPQRIVRPAELPAGFWFFSPRVAVRALQEISEQFEAGVLPARLGLGEFNGDAIWGGLQHLLRYWSDAPPVRRFRRHLIDGPLAAVRGLDDLQRLFSGAQVSAQYEWSLRNASRGGVGVVAPAAPEERVEVGELVGIRPAEGGVWQLAVVRRLWEESSHLAMLGLETLSQKPEFASVDDGRTRTEVFLCDSIHRGEAVRVAAPAHALKPGVPLFVSSNGVIQKLKPLDSAMLGSGFELRLYQVL